MRVIGYHERNFARVRPKISLNLHKFCLYAFDYRFRFAFINLVLEFIVVGSKSNMFNLASLALSAATAAELNSSPLFREGPSVGSAKRAKSNLIARE